MCDVGGGTGFCTLGVVETVNPENVTLVDQSPHQLSKAKAKSALSKVTIKEVGSSCFFCASKASLLPVSILIGKNRFATFSVIPAINYNRAYMCFFTGGCRGPTFAD